MEIARASVKYHFKQKPLFILGYGSYFFSQTVKPGIPDLLVFRECPLNRTDRLLVIPPVTYKLNQTLTSGLRCKIGFVNFQPAIQQLTTWDSFYLPGRLQKPFEVLDVADQAKFDAFQAAIQQNRIQALKIAWLLAYKQTATPPSLTRLYETLVGLSYLGDIRLYFAENPKKVSNIVTGSWDALNSIYQPLMEKAGLTVTESSITSADFDLPMALRNIPDVANVQKALQRLNRKESLLMAVKGVLVNNFIDSALYTARKIYKRFS